MTRTEKMREDFRRQLADQHDLRTDVSWWEGFLLGVLVFGGIVGIWFLMYVFEHRLGMS